MNEYDMIQKLQRRIWWGNVLQEALFVALVALVATWFLVS